MPRMIVHLSWGTVFALAYLAGLSKIWAVSLMAVAFFGLLLLEALRLNYRRYPPEDPIGFLARSYARLGRKFMRRHERRGEWVAALASVGGYLMALALFDQPAAAAGILCSSLGDPAARLVGLRYGTVKLVGRKSLQGSAALALTCFLVAKAVGFATLPALACATAGVLADMASAWRDPLLPLDDNFMTPVACAAALFAAVRLPGL